MILPAILSARLLLQAVSLYSYIVRATDYMSSGPVSHGHKIVEKQCIMTLCVSRTVSITGAIRVSMDINHVTMYTV